MPPAVGVQSPNCWTAGEVLHCFLSVLSTSTGQRSRNVTHGPMLCLISEHGICKRWLLLYLDQNRPLSRQVCYGRNWGCKKPFPSWPCTVSVQNKVIYLFPNQFGNKPPWLGCVSVWLPGKRSKASSKLSNRVPATKT